MKRSKRYRENLEKIKEAENINIDQAIDFLKQAQSAKFDESVEVHLNLNIDPKKSQQQIRSCVELPHGTGKTPKVAVFAANKSEEKTAKSAGADVILDQNEIEKIKNKKAKLDFDIAITTPSMMPKIAKIAKILGPKGLMPNPKNSTITTDIEKTVKELKKGLANIKNDAAGNIHQTIGKLSYKKEQLIENYKTLIENIEKSKPDKVKGKFIKKITLTSSMGPSIKIGRS
ncbi:MAG: 50S ribosomal protein L1 [Candidatus Moranbacteria bacterium]|nr:50S ribosomal protein L1 [Candidatus Moranbacteria bacterium]